MSDKEIDWTLQSILMGNNHSFVNSNQHSLSKPLTQKQYNFTVNYVKNGFNAYQAALDAGYTKSSAQTQCNALVTHPVIKQHIDKAYQKAEKKIINTLGITFVWKLKRLKHIVEQYIPIDGTHLKGHEVKVGLQALTEMNKMMGDYAPAKHVSVNVDATSNKMKEVRKIYDEY